MRIARLPRHKLDPPPGKDGRRRQHLRVGEFTYDAA
jgi:hypothetical protein